VAEEAAAAEAADAGGEEAAEAADAAAAPLSFCAPEEAASSLLPSMAFGLQMLSGSKRSRNGRPSVHSGENGAAKKAALVRLGAERPSYCPFELR
jgi:hypothetical protein